MSSARGSRLSSRNVRDTRFDRPHQQFQNNAAQFNGNERNNSRNKPPSLQFTTDINPACFSGPIPFSLIPNPKVSLPIPAAVHASGSHLNEFRGESRSSKKRDSSQDSSYDEERRYRRDRERRERDRERDREKDRERDRSHSRSYERSERDRPRDHDTRDEIPNNTIMIRSLNSSVTEADLRAEVSKYGLEPKDIRLIREKDSGTSRGFAFVEFSLLSEAVRWKELTKGMIFVDRQSRSTLHYSIPKDSAGAGRNLLNRADWDCSKCGMNNFRRRDYCFKCNNPREDLGDMRSTEGYKEISFFPSNTLLFRNLDVLTTEERVLAMLGQLTTLPIKSLRVAKDILTNTSRGFAFVELHSTSEATQLHDLLLSMGKNFYVDGRQVTVSYAKRSLSSMNSAASANAAVVALAAAQWSNQESEGCPSSNYYGAVSSSENSAGDVQTLGIITTTASSSDLGTVIVDSVTYKRYPVPDTSTYQYDDSSGYFYDSSTGLYYDASSQYYYNSKQQKYLYWDSNQQTYLPAAVDAQAPSADHPVTTAPVLAQDGADADSQIKGSLHPKKEEKQDKVKIAKKIAKDMEKWAKTLNQKKEYAKLGIVQSPAADPVFVMPMARSVPRESASADACFAILEQKASLSERNIRLDEATIPRDLVKHNSADKKRLSLVAQYSDDSDTEGEEESTNVDGRQNQKSNSFDESEFTDWNKIACLLCKRQFPTKEVLLKHQQLSDLHKKNRAKLLAARKSR